MASKFVSNVLTIVSGTAAAQALQIAVSPVLSRLYSVEEFGVLGLFTSIVAIVAIASTGRYENAILLPKDDEDAYAIFVLSLGLSTAVGLVVMLGAIVVGGPAWTYWLGPAIVLTAGLSGLSYWHNRLQHYPRLAMTRVLSSVSNVAVSIGWGQSAGGGLIAGVLAGYATSAAMLGWKLPPLRNLDIAGVAKRYVRFPKLLIIAHLVNSVSQRLPFLLLAPLFGLTVVGLYTLTHRVLSLPNQMIAGAIGEVFRRRASEDYREHGNCRSLYISTFRSLVLLAVPGFTLLYIIAPFMFGLVFGPEWTSAGEMARLLTPMIALQFVSSPLSEMFMIAERQSLDMAWQIALLFGTVSSFVVGYATGNETIAIMLFSGYYTAMYVVSIIMSYRFACGSNQHA